MIRISTGLRTAILGDYGISRMMNYGIIDIYSGAQPAHAHYAPTGTLLGRITKNGGLFTPGSSTNGLRLNKQTAGELRDYGDWVLSGMAEGVAGWWRWKWYMPDTDEHSSYYPRMDGSVGESLILTSTSIVPGTTVPVDQFYLTFRG